MSRSSSHVYEPPAPTPGDQSASTRATWVFDRDGVRAVDRAAIEEYGIPGMVLMENAARGLLDAALKMLSASADGPPHALIICGSGNNGGDGYALARHLHNHGINVTLAPLGEPNPRSDAGINRVICRKMNLNEVAIDQLDNLFSTSHVNLIVDAIFGTGLDRPVSGQAAEVIRWINAARRPVLAADVPSGMDCNTGDSLGCAVKADVTVTFVGLKTGFLGLEAQHLLGEVVVADIGAPIDLLERYGRRIEMPRPESPEHREVESSQAQRR